MNPVLYEVRLPPLVDGVLILESFVDGAMCSTNLVLGSLGELADAVDMIENQGGAKIEETKRLYPGRSDGETFFIFQLSQRKMGPG